MKRVPKVSGFLHRILIKISNLKISKLTQCLKKQFLSCLKTRSKHGHSSEMRSEKDNLKACLVSLHLLWLLQIASQLQAHPPAPSPPDPPTAVICSAKWKCDIYSWNSAQVKRNGVRMSPNDKKMTVK